MSTADKQGEASMDEILASIRKIIADDTVENVPPEPTRPVFPRLDSVDVRTRPSSNTGDGRPLPPVDRFSGALRPQPPTLSGAPKIEQPAPAAFNFGLDDLLDEAPVVESNTKPAPGPPAVPKVVAADMKPTPPAPRLDTERDVPNVAPAVPSPASNTSVKPDKSSLETPAAAAAPDFKPDFKPAFDPAASVAPQTVSEKSDAGAANDPWGAWRSLRLNAQPEPATPPAVAPVTPRIENAPPKRGFYPPAGPVPKPGPTPSFSNVFPRTGGPVTPAQTVAPPAVPALADAAIKPSSNGLDQAPLKKAVEVTEGSVKIDGAVKLNGSVPKPVETKAVVTKSADAAGPGKVDVPVDLVMDSGAKTVSAAATQALDHLAAGLAAATLVSTPSASASQSQSPSVQATTGQPGGPLESIVADMLRPMLEKWIEANMPRILQKALTEPGKKDGQT